MDYCCIYINKICDKETPWLSPKEHTLSILALYDYFIPVKAVCVAKLGDASL